MDTDSGKMLVTGYSTARTDNNCAWTLNVDVNGNREVSVQEGDSDSSVGDTQAFATLVNLNSGTNSVDLSETHACSPNYVETGVSAIMVDAIANHAGSDECGDPNNCDFSIDADGNVLVLGHSSGRSEQSGNIDSDDYSVSIEVNGVQESFAREGNSNSGEGSTMFLTGVGSASGTADIETSRTEHELDMQYRETQVVALDLRDSISIQSDECSYPGDCSTSINHGSRKSLVFGHSSADTGNNKEWDFGLDVGGTEVASTREGNSDKEASDAQGLVRMVNQNSFSLDSWTDTGGPNWYENQIHALELFTGPEFSNPIPAKSNTGSPVETSSPELSIEVSASSGSDVDVSFYNAANDNQIGSTQNDVSDGGTAAVEWSSLQDDETYKWYVEGCSTGCRTSSTFQFDVNGFPEITDIAFDNSTSEHAFTAEATVEDPNGDGDLDSCDATATGGGTSMNYNNLGFDGVDGDNTATCSVEIQYNDPGTNWDHLEDLNVGFTVSDSKNSDTESGSNSFPNNNPRVTDISFSNYSERHRFNTTALLSDPDSVSSGQIDFCSFNFSDGEGNYKYVETSVDNSISTDQAECSYSNINHSITGFEVLEDIDVDVKVGDIHGSNSSAQSSNVIPNSVPYAANPIPSDGDIVFEFPVGLEAMVMDDDVGDTLSTKIYNSDTGEEVESFPPRSSGNEVSTDWEIQNALQQEYSWDVEVSDSWSATNTTFSFTKVVGRTYRSDLSLDLNYSSIVLNAGGNRYTELKVTNNVQNEKNLTVNLTGIDAEFLDGSTVKEIPEFEGQSRRTYMVRISPDEPTDEDLTVVATNNDIGVETEKTIPVTTLSNSQESNEVPGIGAIQLLALSIASTVLYYRLLNP